jgi:hypothetical protein
MRERSMSMMHRALKILEQDDLDRVAKSLGITIKEQPVHRLDLEYAVLADDRQKEIASVVGLMIYQALKKETGQ